MKADLELETASISLVSSNHIGILVVALGQLVVADMINEHLCGMSHCKHSWHSCCKLDAQLSTHTPRRVNTMYSLPDSLGLGSV